MSTKVKKKTKEPKETTDKMTDDVEPLITSIATPMANDKLHQKIYKLVGKAKKSSKGALYMGVREAQKAIRKGKAKNSLVVLAANVSPIDIITHFPVLCEDNKIPYVWVRSKEDLGQSASSKRSTCCILMPQPASDSDYLKNFTKVTEKLSDK